MLGMAIPLRTVVSTEISLRSGGTPTTILSDFDLTGAGFEASLEDAVIAKSYEPLVVGVPEITPEAESSERPGGKTPLPAATE